MTLGLTRDGWERAPGAGVLDITVDATAGIVLVSGHGSLGPDVVSELADITRRFPTCPAIVVDLTDVDKVESPALSGILALIHRCRERQAMVFLAAASPSVAHAIQAVGAHRLAAMAPTRDDALRWATA